MGQRNFWYRFIELYPEFNHESYTAWSFGSNPNGLGQRVIDGEKRATTSARVLYTVEQEPLPFIGQLNMILDENRYPMCMTITTNVQVVSFKDVDIRHIQNEGEGYRTVEAWRQDHISFFNEACQYYGLEFSMNDDVVLETFKCIYPINT
ncbi:ASCH domain-containing protein [Staphylococcus chromogenes]|uniref:ASCH domain-containing protein n=1 Tax=Staphylococcus chromogenes TaxID=46126 RepID=UPI000D19EB84|nr:ASCH domain-containing protein [Staphylococcus chromogenes]PTG23488.1 RNA-binding protein [Staphylococcus chromogenes]